MEPETRFARLGDQRIAYKVLGDGPVDVICSLGSFSSMDGTWAIPEATLPYERLGAKVDLIDMSRGQEQLLTFTADQLGHYELNCGNHSPTMTADILSLSG